MSNGQLRNCWLRGLARRGTRLGGGMIREANENVPFDL